MKSSNLYRKLFLSQYFFTIALCKKEKDNIVNRKKFKAEYIVPANRYDWPADPMLVDYKGKTYLFYEAVIHDKGHIEVAEVKEDCSLGKAKIILKDEGHYSYPFVFRYQDEWYMIPESSSAKEVRLYRSLKFPEKWELKHILLKERAVDTTVFEKNGEIYLHTFVTDGTSERVTPKAYRIEGLPTNPELLEIEWKEYDNLQVRGAGAVIQIEDKYYRPAQISQEQRYGDGLAFYEIESISPYIEKKKIEIMDKDLKTSGYNVDGLHTYCASEKYEAIDIRCREFDLFKVPKILLNRLMK